MKKLLLALAALAATSITFAADAKAPAEKSKADAKCDNGCCCDDMKPAETKDAKAADAKVETKKSDTAKPADRK